MRKWSFFPRCVEKPLLLSKTTPKTKTRYTSCIPYIFMRPIDPTVAKTHTVAEKPHKGKKPSITPEVEQKLIAELLKGYPTRIALHLLMIDEDAFYRRMKNTEFKRKVECAQSEALKPAIDLVMRDSKETKVGAQWLLERRSSEEFAPKNKMQVEQVRPTKTVIKKYSLKDADKR